MGLIPAEDLAALSALRRELGLWPGLSVAIRTRWAQRAGAPFEGLPPPEDWRERASRAQAGSAVLLYRELLRRGMSSTQARALVGRVVHAAALAFLDRSVGEVTPDALAALAPEARRAFVQQRLDAFPNVQARIEETSAEAVRFTVHACRLVQLVTQAGHPELAPLFCAADAHFFGGARPGLALDRPTTIASGDAACRFHIHRSESP